MTATPTQSNGKLNQSSEETIDEFSSVLDLFTRAAELERENKLEDAQVLYSKVAESDEDFLRESALKALENLETMGIAAPSADDEATEAAIFRGRAIDEAIPEATPTEISQVNRQGFANLPILKKQLFSLLGVQVLSVLAITGVGAGLIARGGNQQLQRQAQSELAVTDVHYQIKINQMRFGFRGQSDNAAIIEAATLDANNQDLTAELSQEVKRILQNEIEARNIEYATLVGRDRRILVSANENDRVGMPFDPNGLVRRVMNVPEQITASQIVPWQELQDEGAPLPDGFEEGDALIRYAVTPVRAEGTDEVIGALVSGDIINGKTAIADETLSEFDGGYSAVYGKTESGDFQLATSKLQHVGSSIAEPNIELPSLAIFDAARAAEDGIALKTMSIQGRPFVVAAEAINDFQGNPVAFLVRGTPKAELNQLLLSSTVAQTAAALVLILIGYGVASALARSIANPVQNLQKTSQMFSAGDRSARVEVTTTEEIGQLAAAFNEMADSVARSEAEINQLAIQREAEAEFQKQEKTRLQEGVIRLLLDIEGARDGDLTVQAELEEGEMGTVADAFNVTIANLRELVRQVKFVAAGVQQSASTNEVSVQEMSVEATQQAESITVALASAEDMSESIEVVAQSAQDTADVARQALEYAFTGDQAMTQMVDSIDGIRDSVADTSKKVKRLAESSQEISKIVGIISSISEKTNLLAFNASIEAARAGENGQGFRVVADEVRRLAERVTDATKDIEQLVATIQGETADVLQTMEQSTNQVVAGTQQVTETKQTLKKLAEISLQIDALVQGITASTVSQTEASRTMTQTMQEVAAVAHTSSERSQTVSTSLQDLMSIAHMLQESTSQFQVGEG
ncbi:MAG: methyl-accepting chemotaxis protein [Cyanobacteria bacterium J06639_1]